MSTLKDLSSIIFLREEETVRRLGGKDPKEVVKGTKFSHGELAA